MEKNLTHVELDWAAPVIPGTSMMGLKIGLTRKEVLAALLSEKVDGDDDGGNVVVQFKNSPKLFLEQTPDGITLRDLVSRASNSSKFDELFVIGFQDDILVHLMTSLTYGASVDYYKGKIFGDVGFGTRVAELKKYCEMEFDDGDELFYSEDREYKGLSIGGSCSSLDDDPEQTVSYIRVYKPRP